MKTDRQIKMEATKKEYKRQSENLDLPKSIIAECSDGIWKRQAWSFLGSFGWEKWKKII